MEFFFKVKNIFYFFKENINKLIITLFLLIILRLGNLIPLSGIDHLELKKLLNQDQNTISNFINFINYYNVTNAPLVTPFSLGLGPYINASIIFDFLTILIPFLEKIQLEEGNNGKRKLLVYKKFLAFFFSIIQSIYLINTLQSAIYEITWQNNLSIIWILTVGSLITIWSANLIDEKGLGNGTSLIIFSSVIISLIQNLKKIHISFNSNTFIEIFFLFLFSYFIFLLQQKTYIIDVVSARQLSITQIKNDFFFSKKKSFLISSKNGLLIKLNQAGIFPIIIATNVFSILSYFFNLSPSSFISKILYYFLIIIFNYLYTIFFWNPKKITDELKKNSVSLLNVNPGLITLSYLKRIVYFTSILGGIYLSLLSISYELTKFLIHDSVFENISISSLLILINIAGDFQKKIKIITINTKYKNIL
jgi:preprotein translocase subunit SecY